MMSGNQHIYPGSLVTNKLVKNWRSFWPDQDPIELASQVQENLDAALREWDLQVTEQLFDGWVSVVVKVENIGGEKLVLKAAPEHEEGTSGGAFTRLCSKHIPVVGFRDKGLTLLMIQADPGDSLYQTSSPEERVRCCARLARETHLGPIQPETSKDLLRLQDLAEKIDPEETLHIAAKQHLDTEAIDLGYQAMQEVLQYPEGLCHGDLHSLNVLRHKGEWMIIDGKGWTGPLAFECLELINMYSSRDGLHKEEIYQLLEVWQEETGLGTEQAWLGAAARVWYRIAGDPSFRDPSRCTETPSLLTLGQLELIREAWRRVG